MKRYLVLVALVLSGCGTIEGVRISEAEREKCKEEGCTVWTDSDLQRLMKNIFSIGYQKGAASL